MPNPLNPNIKWYPSPTTPFMQQALVQVSEDIELCVEVGGNPKNPPLLLIMGLGSQLIFWPDNFVQRLIDSGFYVIRFDNRDIGLSSKIERHDLAPVNTLSAMLKLQVGLDNSKVEVAYRLSDLAADTANLITSLGLAKTHVLGASMGGMIAQILAADYPHLVDHLALIFSTNNRPFLAPPRPRQLYTLLKRPHSYAKDDIIEYGKWFINAIGTEGHIDETAVANIARLRYERCFYPKGSLQQLNAILMSGSIQSYSRRIQVPTLVMHGTEDGLLPITHGKTLAYDIPNATFMPIKGMAHDLPTYFHAFIVQQLKKHLLSDGHFAKQAAY